MCIRDSWDAGVARQLERQRSIPDDDDDGGAASGASAPSAGRARAAARAPAYASRLSSERRACVAWRARPGFHSNESVLAIARCVAVGRPDGLSSSA